MKKIFTFLFFTLVSIGVFANAGDTVWVKTFKFEDGRQSRQAKFQFPAKDSLSYEKVLMYYTIKCDPVNHHNQNTDPPCGEWDYDVFTDVLLPTEQLDNENNPIFDVWRIGVYITPYGKQLDIDMPFLNTDGWTYVSDVTDFLPILHDSVLLRDNNGQELLDLRFAFIEGNPVRNIVDIKKVWSSIGYGESGYWDGFPLKSFDNIVKDTTFALNANEKQVKLRTVVTGHMMDGNNSAAEFSSNIHKVKANGNVIKQWQILQNCGEMAMYPQGGTWLYPRAGWCPGMQGTVNEFELTDFVQNNSINFDYDVKADPNGVYRMYAFLVTYGEILQNNDAAAEMIIAPNSDPNQRRYNPSAFSPIVVIKNLGKNNLKSVEIKYGFEGTDEISQTWNGDLGFLQKDTVVLTKIPDWNKIEGNSAKFFFELINPNGTADPTQYNNALSVKCEKPLVFTQNELYFAFKTNKKPKETSWQLTDIYGNTLYSVDADTLKSTKSYSCDFKLANGTYCLTIADKDGDGLAWWANTDGSGSAKLQYFNEEGSLKTLYTFEPDFGSFINLWFAVNEFSQRGVQNPQKGEVPIFPNPANDEIYLDLTKIDGQNLSVIITDIAGKVIIAQSVNKLQINRIGVQGFNSGLFFAAIKDGKKRVASGKFIKK
ncbi:MAG: T9SS type A sorting domain-containing protein [Prevotellaceae bacterium]|jgi:hypothetical protein|nr:T9SS type A sorting domain-containing protein [Prevotellaceae bacterium]